MKKLSLFNKVAYVLNSILALLTFLGYVLPYLTPKFFPFLSVLTLVLPVLLILNFVFVIYWLVQFKRQLFISSIILFVGTPYIPKMYKITTSTEPILTKEEGFSIMSYNVHYFNLYQWIDKDVSANMSQFFKEKSPDILCLQEYHPKHTIDFKAYTYQHIHKERFMDGQAILSKFPIINKGNVAFENSSNKFLYADILINKDTLRVYSVHLQSTKISDDINKEIDSEKSEIIFNRLGAAFKQQLLQADIINEHKKTCTYPIVICGDVNNSAFSYVYRTIKGNLNDCFESMGKGFGRTYNFKYYPARIDFIFSDKRLQVAEFETFDDFSNSDHFPILSRFSFMK